MNQATTSVISDLFINLSAGWIGAAIIVPITTTKRGKISLLYLLTDVAFAILALLIAIKLRNV